MLKVYQEASGVLGNIDSSSIAKEACNVLCAGLNVFYPSVSERNQLLHRLLVEGSTISIYVALHNLNNYQHNISYRLNFCSIRAIYVMIAVSSFICKIHYISEFVTGEHIWGLAYLRDLVLIEFSELLDSYTLDLENISNLRYLDLLKAHMSAKLIQSDTSVHNDSFVPKILTAHYLCGIKNKVN